MKRNPTHVVKLVAQISIAIAFAGAIAVVDAATPAF